MSLTSFLAGNKDVRERFRQEFQKPNFSVKGDILAPPLTQRYTLIGTAFDYLFRFYLQRLNPNTIDKEYWVAEMALPLIKNNPPLLHAGQEIVAQAKERLSAFLATGGQMEDTLIKSAILLAQLDPIFRAGVGHENVGHVDDDDIQDVKNLISIVNPDIFRANRLCLINPTFGGGSILVGGADADVLIDETLIDIKTTKNPSFQRAYFDQLMGYYALHQIGGIGELTPKPEIKKVATYFSRHAFLHILNVEEIIDTQTFPTFIEWMINRNVEEYGFPPEVLKDILEG